MMNTYFEVVSGPTKRIYRLNTNQNLREWDPRINIWTGVGLGVREVIVPSTGRTAEDIFWDNEDYCRLTPEFVGTFERVVQVAILGKITPDTIVCKNTVVLEDGYEYYYDGEYVSRENVETRELHRRDPITLLWVSSESIEGWLISKNRNYI